MSQASEFMEDYHIEVVDGKVVLSDISDEDGEYVDYRVNFKDIGAEPFLYECTQDHYDHLDFGYALAVYFTSGKFRGQAAYRNYGQGNSSKQKWIS